MYGCGIIKTCAILYTVTNWVTAKYEDVIDKSSQYNYRTSPQMLHSLHIQSWYLFPMFVSNVWIVVWYRYNKDEIKRKKDAGFRTAKPVAPPDCAPDDEAMKELIVLFCFYKNKLLHFDVYETKLFFVVNILFFCNVVNCNVT